MATWLVGSGTSIPTQTSARSPSSPLTWQKGQGWEVGRFSKCVLCSVVSIVLGIVGNSGRCSVVIQPFPHIKVTQTSLRWRKACLENWRGGGGAWGNHPVTQSLGSLGWRWGARSPWGQVGASECPAALTCSPALCWVGPTSRALLCMCGN